MAAGSPSAVPEPVNQIAGLVFAGIIAAGKNRFKKN